MNIAIAGGDRRFDTVEKIFCEKGYLCNKIDFCKADLYENLHNASVVILPFPYCKGEFLNAPFSENKIAIDDIFGAAKEDTIFLGGGIPETAKNRIDYAKREDFLIKNAIATAEGAIEIAMNTLKITLESANAVVLGYGRIGSRLAHILKAFGAKTTIVARRKEVLTQAKANGLEAIGFSETEALLPRADIVFNTVPCHIAGEKEISLLKPNALFIDLASFPFGIDEKAKALLGNRYIQALSLPGKYAPETSGRIVFDAVYEILREKGVVT